MIDALSSHLVERFQKVLDDPILEAFSIFDVRKWPADKDVLKDSYINGIKLLYKTYKIFYAEEETEEMVLEQWEDLKVESTCRRNNCLNTCLNTCFPVSTLGVLTPVLVSQHLILNAKKCLNVKPTPLSRTVDGALTAHTLRALHLSLLFYISSPTHDPSAPTILGQYDGSHAPARLERRYLCSVKYFTPDRVVRSRGFAPSRPLLRGHLAWHAVWQLLNSRRLPI